MSTPTNLPTDLAALAEPDSREVKLPVWVQDTLRCLRKAMIDQHNRAEAARLATNPAKSSAVLDAFDRTPIGLGEQARVRFILDREDQNTHLECTVTPNGRLQVTGSRSIFLRPRVSNVVEIWVGR